MSGVRAIGGVFFKARAPERLAAWYRDHLGVPLMGEGPSTFGTFGWRELERPDREGQTVWSLFPADTDYFAPSAAAFMVNYVVDDLDGVVAQLAAAGIPLTKPIESGEYGRFAWLVDPEGNKIELWEPPAGDPPAPTVVPSDEP
jgi:predicted enzyme related to lactoylglutathione lyase